MLPLYTCWQPPETHFRPIKPGLADTVAQIIADVQTRGDTAVAHWASHWGDKPPRCLTQAEAMALADQVPAEVKASLDEAARNIRQFGQAVMDALKPAIALHQAGASMGARFRPVDSVGCYVPGGRYPLPSTALMTAITAQVAGVPNRVLVSPQLVPSTVYAGLLAGVQQFVEVGGAQALAALAFGTETIPAVAMVVGPVMPLWWKPNASY